MVGINLNASLFVAHLANVKMFDVRRVEIWPVCYTVFAQLSKGFYFTLFHDSVIARCERNTHKLTV